MKIRLKFSLEGPAKEERRGRESSWGLGTVSTSELTWRFRHIVKKEQNSELSWWMRIASFHWLRTVTLWSYNTDRATIWGYLIISSSTKYVCNSGEGNLGDQMSNHRWPCHMQQISHVSPLQLRMKGKMVQKFVVVAWNILSSINKKKCISTIYLRWWLYFLGIFWIRNKCMVFMQ